MKILPEKLKEIVLKAGFVSVADLEKAEKVAGELGKPLEDVLIFQGIIPEQSLSQLIAEYFKVPFAPIKHRVIPLEILQLVPENLARSHRILPFDKKGDELFLAMEDPEDFEAVEAAKRHSGLKVKLYFVTPDSLTKGLAQYKKNIRTDFEKIISQNVKKSRGVGKTNLSKVASEVPVVKIFDTILQYAVAERASDIHIELLEEGLVIRFRIDGILKDIISLPAEIQSVLVARVKILSKLKIDEHRLAQDGRFKFKVDEEFISLRVSILPTFYGENVVMRLLFESTRPLSLEELGFAGKNLEVVRDNIAKPHGLILVTGPTGCGKTTSLYSIMNILNSVGVKICTVEDPIEYAMNRVSQTQVNTISGLTFAVGMRALVRHDPDIIMVGEIRDRETVEMAIHAALTGHLVLSTLHTNDAVGGGAKAFRYGGRRFSGGFDCKFVNCSKIGEADLYKLYSKI